MKKIFRTDTDSMKDKQCPPCGRALPGGLTAGFTPFEVEREHSRLSTRPNITQERERQRSTFFLRSRLQTGFTLLEMIIAIGIFLTSLTIILGALVSVNEAARKTRSERIVADNVSAAIDSMSRMMRVGSKFNCGCVAPLTTPRNCANPMTALGGGGDTCIAFEGQLGNPTNDADQIVYRLSGRRIQRSTNSGTSYVFLTAPELNISTLRFYLYGTALNDDQPVVTMLVRGSASTTRRTATTFDVQTTVAAYTPSLTFP